LTPLIFGQTGDRLSVLCLGAHSDDIEIGAGWLILTLAESVPDLRVHWCVLSAAGQRAAEAQESAQSFLYGLHRKTIEIGEFEESYFPTQTRDIKMWLAHVRTRFSPDVVLVHERTDAHQDHRELNTLAWNLFRDHLILEYEIPKWDGDMSQPNLYLPLDEPVLERKTALLMRHFGTQRSKDWFDAETFRSLARLRGMECRAESRYAEAFTIRKANFSPAPSRSERAGDHLDAVTA
jgi:LmbE family N-acetylglucosaminyl deacetylase